MTKPVGQLPPDHISSAPILSEPKMSAAAQEEAMPPSADNNATTVPDFWDWSLKIYDHHGIPAQLLRLQDDHGLNVNLLLWCCWCGLFFEDTPTAPINQAYQECERWSAEIARNLRRARKALKKAPSIVDETLIQGLRKRVKKAELDAEHIEQNILSGLAITSLTPRVVPSENLIVQKPLIISNLTKYQSIAAKNPVTQEIVGQLADAIIAAAITERDKVEQNQQDSTEEII